MQPTDDSALLREYAENHSDDAFAMLVTRHINLVYSVALRHVGDPHYAEEITQAVFIILAKKALQLRHERALSSWLFQATRLTANNFVRSTARRHHREQEAYMQSVFNESGSDVWQQIAPLLDSAVAALEQKDRRAIMLRFFEGRNLGEVGSALGINEEAARKRVNRALDKLRLFFARRGVDSTAATIAETISVNSVQAAPVALAKTVTAVAVAKGAAASTSTLILIKGALKTMAWAKAKRAIVAGVAVILTVSSTTVVSVELARAYHLTADSRRSLSIYSETVTVDLLAEGPALYNTTLELTNSTSHTVTGLIPFQGNATISRIVDASGQPLKYARQNPGSQRYWLTLPGPVPPGGNFSYTIEGNRSDVTVPGQPSECGAVISAPPDTDLNYTQVWRLPAGAQVLDKNDSLDETTNAGRIELRFGKVIPPMGNQNVAFRYLLPIKAN